MLGRKWESSGVEIEHPGQAVTGGRRVPPQQARSGVRTGPTCPRHSPGHQRPHHFAMVHPET